MYPAISCWSVCGRIEQCESKEEHFRCLKDSLWSVFVNGKIRMEVVWDII